MTEAARAALQRGVASRRAGGFDEARRDLAEAAEECRNAGDKPGLALVLRELGETERNAHDATAAVGYYLEAIALLREAVASLRGGAGNTFLLAHTIRHLGDVYCEFGQAPLAEPCFREALALYGSQQHAPALDFANAMRSLAVLKDEAGEVAEARALWTELHERYAGLGIEAGVEESSRRLERLGPIE